MARPTLTFARFVVTTENRAAWVAVQELAAVFANRGAPAGGLHAGQATGKLLVLHGPPGSGKTHLVHALAGAVTQQRPDRVVCVLAAGEIMRAPQPSLFAAQEDVTLEGQGVDLEEARNCDLLIVEDLQHLNVRAAESLVQTIDYLEARQRPLVFTANAGPQRLNHRGERFPARLTSRLAAGLVVGLDPLGAASRLTLLQMLAQRCQLAVPTAILRWLADCLTGGGRQLAGAIGELQALAKLQPGPLDLATVKRQFQHQADASKMTVKRIAERVGGYFHVASCDLQSQRRCRSVLVPRQVGMYLARQLTGLSLDQIGQYFGGRDHSTVLHACRKMEHALGHDAILSGAVREIHAGLA